MIPQRTDVGSVPRLGSLFFFAASACKVSGLKDGADAPANSVCSDRVTHLLSMLCVLTKILSHASAKKKTKRKKTKKTEDKKA